MKNDFSGFSINSFSLILFSFFLLFSCSPTKKKPEFGIISSPIVQPIAPLKDTSISSGVVHKKIFCKRDSLQSYSLYLPTTYSAINQPGKAPANFGKFSVIYFFDSHADGVLPVEKYKGLAEKYNFIIAGSNVSKNGLPADILQHHVEIFMEDVKEKFSVDPGRVYTSGFSGGSRVASSIALKIGGIAGVAGCGAGFPNMTEPIRTKFNFIGVAGEADFNLIELKNLNLALENSPLKHELVFFDGKHEWPPEKTMEEVFLWFEFNAMAEGLIPKNDSIIKSFIKKSENEIFISNNDNNLSALAVSYKKIINSLDGLADVSVYQKKLAVIEKSPAYISILNNQKALEKRELENQQEYSAAFASKNVEWWIKAIKNLKSEKSLEAKRMLGYLGLVAYMYSNNGLNKNLLPETDVFLKIYALLEPENPEHAYMRAQLFIKTGQREMAIESLKKAILLGFNDKNRIENDEVFSSLKNQDEFSEIISSIK